MTILQLRYVITISNSASMREAAGKLYVSQPALSASVHELEEEIGFKIFDRNSRGISLTQDGLEFLSYAKQAVSQYEIIEERYIEKDRNRMKFSVSTQHYVFAVHAFMETVKKIPYPKYVFSIHETRTDEVLGNVKDLISEIGIVSYTKTNENVIKKLFRDYGLEFYPLMRRDTYVYVWKNHPLSGYKEISLDDLKDYPCVAFEQSSRNDFYLNEEALGNYDFDRVIKTNDRATSVEIVAGLNGYSVGTGFLSDSMAITDGLVCIKLKEEDPLTIGYIIRKGYSLSEVGKRYVEELNRYKEI
ncbi:MAG: LysR family transcriptional regulator [Lachnospiraceae bacterium]